MNSVQNIESLNEKYKTVAKQTLLTVQIRRVLFDVIGKAEKSVDNSVTYNGLTIGIKNIS